MRLCLALLSKAITGTTAVITVTGDATSVDGQTYVLTPTASGNTLTWDDSASSCIASGLC